MPRFKFTKKKLEETIEKKSSSSKSLNKSFQNGTDISVVLDESHVKQSNKNSLTFLSKKDENRSSQFSLASTFKSSLITNSIWKKNTLYISPFPRYKHTASLITTENDEVFFMGGVKNNTLFGDIWKIIPQESTSNNVFIYVAKKVEVATSIFPCPRMGHASVLCGNAFVVYGGYASEHDIKASQYNCFYLFNIHNNKYTLLNHVMNNHKQIYGHTVGVISLNDSTRLYLFGGKQDDEVFNDLFFFNLNNFKSLDAAWEKVKPINDFKPPPLVNHTMSIYKNKIYIFGGSYHDKEPSNDLWCYDTSTNRWSKVFVSGSLPLPVYEHASCVVGDRLYVYGGTNNQNQIYSSLYVLDLNTLFWVKIEDSSDINGPGLRYGHTLTYLNKFHKLLLMGGVKKNLISTLKHDSLTDTPSDNKESDYNLYDLDLKIVDQIIIFNNQLKNTNTISTNKTELNQPNAKINPHFLRSVDYTSLSNLPSDFDKFGMLATSNTNLSKIEEINNNSKDENQVLTSSILKGSNFNKTIGSTRELKNQNSFSHDNFNPKPINSSEISINDESLILKKFNYDNSNEIRSLSNFEIKETLKENELNNNSFVDDINKDIKVKQLVQELTLKLNQLKESTRIQLFQSTDKINQLEQENLLLSKRNYEEITVLKKKLNEKDLTILELQQIVDINSLGIDSNKIIESDEDKNKVVFSDTNKPLISEKTKLILEKFELNNKLVNLEQDNVYLLDLLVKFESYMDNQVYEFSNFEKLLAKQEQKIAKLQSSIEDQNKLKSQIIQSNTNYEKLKLEFSSYKTLHSDCETSETDDNFKDQNTDCENIDGIKDKYSLHKKSKGSNKNIKKEVSFYLQELIKIWSDNESNFKKKMNEDKSIGSDKFSIKNLQDNINDLIELNKKTELNLNNEINILKKTLNEKVNALKLLEDNYKDALKSVDNTSRALQLTQEQLNNKKKLIETLKEEINDLNIFKHAREEVNMRDSTSVVDDTQNVENYEGDSTFLNTHYKLKLKNLQADFYVLKQERDKLKEEVTGLQKQMYLYEN